MFKLSRNSHDPTLFSFVSYPNRFRAMMIPSKNEFKLNHTINLVLLDTSYTKITKSIIRGYGTVWKILPLCN